LLNVKRIFGEYYAYSLAFLIALIILWEIVCDLGYIARLYLAPPSAIVASLWEMTLTGEIAEHLSASMYRVAIGVALGSAIGIVVGFLLGISKFFYAIVDPIIAAIYPLPKIALLPLIILWFGIGEESKIFVIALTAFFPVAINTLSGVRTTDPILIKAAENLGAKRSQVITKVILPSSLYSILTGLRLGIGLALVVLVSAEMIAAKSGLGFFVLLAADLLLTSKLFVGLLILSILGILTTKALEYLNRKLIPWRAY
jgi:NitT/TauT family transport system permease protein